MSATRGITMSFIRLTLSIFSAVMALSTAAHAEAPAPSAATVQNLQAAYDGESNAHARYVAFAVAADTEGYHQVASLFRAAAAAEKIHAANHAKVIEELGAVPKADVKKPEVKSTRENLSAAIAGESYERDTMYPGFIKTADQAGLAKAVRTFKYAAAAEASHAKFYAEALANLEGWRTGTRSFYVCAVCGETLAALPDVRCPVCKAGKDKFEVVS
ncbi:MAG: rubrerythrin family protein [Deltaproteobacteria bacterium]|nr:rubrerythrin family protein [Deltaproteobacteria bacterium]